MTFFIHMHLNIQMPNVKYEILYFCVHYQIMYRYGDVFMACFLFTLMDTSVFIGTANNAGAILVLGRDLIVVPKLIHPLPPAITSRETSPDRSLDDTWMQVCEIQAFVKHCKEAKSYISQYC